MTRLALLALTAVLLALHCVPARADFRSQLIEHVRDHIAKDISEALKRYFRQPAEPDTQRALSPHIVRCAVEAMRLDEQRGHVAAITQRLANTAITSPSFAEIRARHAQEQKEFDQAVSAHRAGCYGN